MSTLDTAAERVRLQASMVSTLANGAWTKTRIFSVVTLSRTIEGAAADAMAEVADLDSVEVIADASFGDAKLRVVRDQGGHCSVNEPSALDLHSTFPRDLWTVAEDAWDGDWRAALSLPGTWVLRCSVDLAAPLSSEQPAVRWQVLPNANALEDALRNEAVWELGDLLDGNLPSVFLLEDLPMSGSLSTSRMTVGSLQSPNIASFVRAVVENPKETFSLPDLPRAPHPDSIAPRQSKGLGLANLESLLWGACSTIAWLSLATRTTVTAGNRLDVEIFGLQRVSHRIESRGFSTDADEAQAALELFRWTSGNDAIDQRLATQQVASLYRDSAPWLHSRDVLEAAIAVFKNLRREAVSEVLQARRAAFVAAVDAAQSTSAQVAAIARSTVERCVATLLAVGGVIVGESTKALSATQAESLRHLLAGFLIFLIVWHVIVEAPNSFAALPSFKKDLPTTSDLLTDRERAKVLDLQIVKGTSTRVWCLRFAVPLAYAAAALAAWVVN